MSNLIVARQADRLIEPGELPLSGIELVHAASAELPCLAFLSFFSRCFAGQFLRGFFLVAFCFYHTVQAEEMRDARRYAATERLDRTGGGIESQICEIVSHAARMS